MSRKALGRGLDALIPAVGEKGGGGGEITSCKIEEISPGRFQPRQKFPEEKLRELADSIAGQGVLQPLLVRRRETGGFELIAGERRWRAAKLAGLSHVPVVVREVNDRQALELSLVENLQREDLNPLEQAEAYRRLITEFNYTQEEVSRRVGKDRATVSNLLRLLKLPEEIKEDLREGRLTEGHARALLMAGSETLMRTVRDAIINEGISVREAERRAGGGKVRKSKSPLPAAKVPAGSFDVHLKEIRESLVRELGTRVKITGTSKGGKIEIQFYSAEDLDRIYRRIRG